MLLQEIVRQQRLCRKSYDLEFDSRFFSDVQERVTAVGAVQHPQYGEFAHSSLRLATNRPV
jgi:hypothetical protein